MPTWKLNLLLHHARSTQLVTLLVTLVFVVVTQFVTGSITSVTDGGHVTREMTRVTTCQPRVARSITATKGRLYKVILVFNADHLLVSITSELNLVDNIAMTPQYLLQLPP